jgi:DNA-binding transcriptional regulator LsrR (DeoR family)
LIRNDAESSLAARAAWLHYAGGLTQAEVAKRLGLNNLKAHRLIAKANQDGLVKVYVDGEVSECIELEDRICESFALDTCEVVPEFDQEDLPLNALGIAGAQFLQREIQNKKNHSIGIGHGRTLAACIDNLPAKTPTNTEFVSLLGGITRNFSANPHDVIHRLAGRVGAHAYVMPVPFIANSTKDKEVLMQQRGILEVFELARQTSLKIVGIGTTALDASLVATGMIEQEELAELEQAGAVGELLGHFFNASGSLVKTDISTRLMSLPASDLKGKRIVAVAGGKFKTRAIRSVLKSRFLSGLVTDERTARTLAK